MKTIKQKPIETQKLTLFYFFYTPSVKYIFLKFVYNRLNKKKERKKTNYSYLLLHLLKIIYNFNTNKNWILIYLSINVPPDCLIDFTYFSIFCFWIFCFEIINEVVRLIIIRISTHPIYVILVKDRGKHSNQVDPVICYQKRHNVPGR